MKTSIAILMLIVLTSIGPPHARAQESKANDPGLVDRIQEFVERYQISLRQSVIDRNAIEKPAMFQFVHPSDGEDSYSIDFGLSASLFPKESELVPAQHWFIGPTVEYHRQTQIKKEQDNFQAGLTAIWIPVDISEGSGHFIQASLKYKDDRKGVGEGFLWKARVYTAVGKISLGRGQGTRLVAGPLAADGGSAI